MTTYKPHLLYLTVLNQADSFTYDTFFCNEDVYGSFESSHCVGAFACLCHGDSVCPEWLCMMGTDVLRAGPKQLAREIGRRIHRLIDENPLANCGEIERLQAIHRAVLSMPMDCWLSPETIKRVEVSINQ